jgi:alkanesulfonate monooxygenase SsuD/methylene tetrahydromethanopterin reductase-like flavin-dependent oxidoreductase (luciferase family)
MQMRGHGIGSARKPSVRSRLRCTRRSTSAAIRGGSVAECLDWLARYVEAGARHLILRIGSLTAGPESVAEQLLPALKEIG